MPVPDARWWEIRRAQNLSGSVYRCPLCEGPLPALTPHLLITPEGDGSRRRHAHGECVMAARREGRLPTRDEWREASGEPRPRGWLRRALHRGD